LLPAKNAAWATIYVKRQIISIRKAAEIYDLFTRAFPITGNSRIALAPSLVTTTPKNGGTGEING
jgi:hypothetical protein